MRFQSTRDKNTAKYSSAQVIKKGLADDGGLFVPESIPTLSSDDLLHFSSLSYYELAANVLSKFLTDYTYGELLDDCKKAYSESAFPNGACRTVKVKDGVYSLELWHGPTCAFKDMALQLMPRLLSKALVKTGEKRSALILVATSGDTGKAALEGYKDTERIKICVFYPENGVSSVQKLQMMTQTGDNVHVCAVNGNFDDIQSGVKKIFSDTDIAAELDRRAYLLSSANSINFARLAPQIIYYIKAYCDLVVKKDIDIGDKINVCVPTGNFGNILAAYIAKLMGLPINRLICASNSNNVLTEFLQTGRYDKNRDFHITMSPSMDILISSNLERLLYFICGADKTAEYMNSLNENGHYEVDSSTMAKISKHFAGYCANEYDTSATIRHYYDTYGYLMDTHTAVAFCALEQYRKETGDDTVTVVASTASPYKFAKDVHDSIFDDVYLTDFEALTELSKRTNTPIPAPLKDLENRDLRFTGTVTVPLMYNEIKSFLEK